MKDKYLLIISIFIGITLWYYVFSSENRETSISIPVTIYGENAGMIAFVKPKNVTIKLSGPQAFVSKARNTQIVLNVENKPEGKNLLEITAKNVRTIGLEVVSITPDIVEVDMIKTLRKNFRVKPEFSGELPKGYKLGKITVFPVRVEVEGTNFDLNNMNNIVSTSQIPLDSLKENTDITVDFAEYSGVKNINPNRAKVSIEILEDIVYQTYSSRVHCTEGTSTEEDLPVIFVTVKGRKDLLDTINNGTILAEIDCSVYSGGVDTKVSRKKLDNLEVMSTTPPMVNKKKKDYTQDNLQ